ncbi:NIL domain-containing protein [Sorangium sp. So ce542]|uniref:NIL domain-containing protein n=1 Tax=Sorangium sp. So ce542 TaxID=3133316 RepID=UPI003F5E5E15
MSSIPLNGGSALLRGQQSRALVGDTAAQPVLAVLARRFGVDATLLEGTLERVGGVPVGRLLVELTGERPLLHRALGTLVNVGRCVRPAIPGDESCAALAFRFSAL